MRRLAVHSIHSRDSWWQSRCGTAGTTTEHTSDVTCRRCLYSLRLYVPLVKLREHQDAQSTGRAKYGGRDPFYSNLQKEVPSERVVLRCRWRG